MSELADVLNRAGDLVEEGWCRLHLAENEVGLATNHYSPEAVRFCPVGAVDVATFGTSLAFHREALEALAASVGLPGIGEIAPWNDDPARTQAEVVAAFRAAAEAAK